jgi:alkylhydroperoxidase/carboxymuconolactone decarboxylase family protein YurZ
MSNEMEEIERFARSTLGAMPEVIKLLGNHNVEMAKEQFRENNTLYLGRTKLPKKILALTALSVSLANGQSDSAMIHFKLAQKFEASMLEVLDSIKAAKMALMSSTMALMGTIQPIVEKFAGPSHKSAEIERILNHVKTESGMDFLPENLSSLASVSFNLLEEHLKEKAELMSPFEVEQKYLFLMAFAVSISIRYEECARVYLTQFFLNGGKKEEMEDALFLTRFITGNRALTSAMEILKW